MDSKKPLLEPLKWTGAVEISYFYCLPLCFSHVFIYSFPGLPPWSVRTNCYCPINEIRNSALSFLRAKALAQILGVKCVITTIQPEIYKVSKATLTNALPHQEYLIWNILAYERLRVFSTRNCVSQLWIVLFSNWFFPFQSSILFPQISLLSWQDEQSSPPQGLGDSQVWSLQRRWEHGRPGSRGRNRRFQSRWQGK